MDDEHRAERPATGLRIVLEREESAGTEESFAYAGAVLSPEESLEVRAEVAADGAVTVTAEGTMAPTRRAALTEKVRLLVRSLVRQARTDELPPPRRINRWRE